MDRVQAGARGLLTTIPPARPAVHAGVAAAFAAVGVLLLSFALASIAGRGGTPILPGWSAGLVDGAYAVTEVESELGLQSLRPGDRLVSVAGDDAAGFYGPALALARVPAGGAYPVKVLRTGAPVAISLMMNRAVRPDWPAFVPILLVAVLLYSAAAWIGVAKWGDLTGWLASASFFLSALMALGAVLLDYAGWSRATAGLALVLAAVWRPWQLAVGYHFLSRFPQAVPLPAAAAFVQRPLYAAAAVLWIPVNLPLLAHLAGIRPNPVLAALLRLSPGGQPGGLIMAGFELFAGAAICAVLVHNYLRLPDPDSRRRIRWAGLAFASVLVVFMVFALMKAVSYLTGSALAYRLQEVANQLGTVVVGIAPVALAYAVVKHRVLGIHFVVRRGVHYLLAKKVLQLVVLLPVLIVLFDMVENPRRSLDDVLFHSSWPFYAAVAVTGGFSLRYRRQMRLWLDRKFFRAAYEQEKALVELIAHIKTADSEEELSVAAARQIDHALHLDDSSILLRDHADGHLRVAYSRLTDRAARMRDWLNGEGAGPLGDGAIFTLYETEDSVPSGAGPAQAYRENLVVPLAAAGSSNIGALVLGPKRSEEPYTHRDRDLLTAIAGQMVVAYEVLRLRARVEDQQRVRVEVLGHLERQRILLLSECPDCGYCYTAADPVCARDGANLTLTLPVERTIEDKYRLDRRIGRGGMGVVYQAADTRLGRPVAIKIMIGDLFGRASALARFEREARAAALLNHANIIRVYDFGKLAAGGAYYVMELIRGRSWREHLRDPRPIPAGVVSQWIAQLCSAVAAAHAKGIIHRDLKPENLMISEEDPAGRVVVLDFGLAKMRAEMSRADRDLTVAGAVMGSHGYMSPEQRIGGAVDLRTDIYSVAVICTETFTGVRPPLTGASRQWARASCSRVAGGGAALSEALERALSESPWRRPSSIAEFHQELSGAIGAAIPRPEATGGGSATGSSTDTLPMGR